MAELEPESTADLPSIDPSTGFLPEGIHPCTWDEFVQVFVDEAPHPEHRRRRLNALEVWIDCLDEILPGATLWLDGGFVSHKADPPFDIDVLATVDPAVWAPVGQQIDVEMQAFGAWAATQLGAPPKTPTLTSLGGLMTLQNVQEGNGRYFPRVQPVGGRIDGFVFPADLDQTLANFRGSWMIDYASGTPKGFVEVSPDDR